MLKDDVNNCKLKYKELELKNSSDNNINGNNNTSKGYTTLKLNLEKYKTVLIIYIQKYEDMKKLYETAKEYLRPANEERDEVVEKNNSVQNTVEEKNMFEEKYNELLHKYTVAAEENNKTNTNNTNLINELNDTNNKLSIELENKKKENDILEEKIKDLEKQYSEVIEREKKYVYNIIVQSEKNYFDIKNKVDIDKLKIENKNLRNNVSMVSSVYIIYSRKMIY